MLLASAVFSLAGRSRQVASRSVTLHSLNESLRSATVVRAQITFAAYLTESDRVFGTTSRVAIKVSILEARRNLVELRRMSSGGSAAEGFDATTLRILKRFTLAADRTLDVTESDEPAGAQLIARTQVLPAFDVLRDRLVERRDDALADLKAAGNLLGRLGGLASFVIAFVLPTVALLAYRQMTRRTRDSVELAAALTRERGRGTRRRQLLALSLTDLKKELANVEAFDADARLTAVRRLGWNVDALATVVSGTGTLAFADVDLSRELRRLAAALREAEVEVTVAGTWGTAWTDPHVFGAAVRNLVLEAEDSGARRIEIESSTSGEHAEIRIAHDGAGLSPALASRVFERSSDDERSAVEAGGVPIRLLAAQEAIEAMTGSLAHLTGLGRPKFIIRLPRTELQQKLDSSRDELLAPAAA